MGKLYVMSMLVACGCGRIGFDTPVTLGEPIPGGVDLETVAEMNGGNPVASARASVTFHRTRTVIAPDDYNGEVAYAFEVVAENDDAIGRQVALLDADSGAQLASLTVPATGDIELLRTPFVPEPGSAAYVLQTGASSTDYAVNVYDARIVIRQQGATRTRLWMPLVWTDQTATNNDDGFDRGTTDESMSGTYSQPTPAHYAIWLKDAAQLTEVAAGAPWRFESVQSVIQNVLGQGTFVSLFDRTTGAQVVASELVTANVSALEDGEADFADSALPAGDEFEVRMHAPDTGVTSYLFKATLSVELDGMTQGQVRLHVAGNLTPGELSDTALETTDLGAFTAPSVAFEATTGSGDMSLLDAGSAAIPTDFTKPVAGGMLTAGTNTKVRVRSAPLSLTSSDNYEVLSGTATASEGVLVVNFGD